MPASLDLKIALDNSVQNQTYNTPAVATLVMLNAHIEWLLRRAVTEAGRLRVNDESSAAPG